MSAGITEITSRQNERVKNVVKLQKRREREDQGLFLVEGFTEVRRLLDSGRAVSELYCCVEHFRGEAFLPVVEEARKRGIAVFNLIPSVFEKISQREGSDGLLAVAPTWSLGLASVKLSQVPLLIVAESIEKPGNLGSLIRTAEAVGADALLVCDPVTDVFNPNVVRASRGLVCARSVALASPEEVAAFLKTHGIQSVALMPEAQDLYWDIDWKKPSAIVVGSEWAGLSPFWEKGADYAARLPMHGAGDSLNVSVAASVTLYEALRQRGSQA